MKSKKNRIRKSTNKKYRGIGGSLHDTDTIMIAPGDFNTIGVGSNSGEPHNQNLLVPSIDGSEYTFKGGQFVCTINIPQGKKPTKLELNGENIKVEGIYECDYKGNYSHIIGAIKDKNNVIYEIDSIESEEPFYLSIVISNKQISNSIYNTVASIYGGKLYLVNNF